MPWRPCEPMTISEASRSSATSTIDRHVGAPRSIAASASNPAARASSSPSRAVSSASAVSQWSTSGPTGARGAP